MSDLTAAEFDPIGFVDREEEARRFETLLGLATHRRILAVSDDSGWGKSTFLKKLRHQCDYDYLVPVALVPLEEFDDRPDEFELVSDVAKQLTRAEVPFPTFNELNRLRSFHDSGIFVKSLRGIVNASNATISGGQVAGTIFNIEHYDSVGAPPWTDEADRQAKQLCLNAFLAELFEAAREQKIVIIFDNVELATVQLRHFLLKTLVTDRILAELGAKHKLIIVMAGEKLHPRLASMFKDLERFDVIPALGSLRPSDVDRLFEVKGLNTLPPDQLTWLREQIVKREVSLAKALAIAKLLQVG
jgi:hypothetical protein